MRDELAALAANEIAIRVELGERSYDIFIGDDLLEAAGSRIAAAASGRALRRGQRRQRRRALS